MDYVAVQPLTRKKALDRGASPTLGGCSDSLERSPVFLQADAAGDTTMVCPMDVWVIYVADDEPLTAARRQTDGLSEQTDGRRSVGWQPLKTALPSPRVLQWDCMVANIPYIQYNI